MKHLKLLLLGALVVLPIFASAAETPLWLRSSAISPDGKTIVFSYKGDLFTVSSSGGKAIQITTNPAYDTRPVWSPDSKRIAFASNREGGFDVFTISPEGGTASRITFHSANEYPEGYTAKGTILFSMNELPTAQYSRFPMGTQLYEVSEKGGRPMLFSPIQMEDVSLSVDGQTLLYHDNKGYEDKWRKRHSSSITRDVWLYDTKSRTHRQLTTSQCEDRNPVFGAAGEFYYLSEQNGSFNIFKSSIESPGKAQQITQLKDHPVRYLTRSSEGTLCFSYNGELYTLKGSKSPQKVKIEVVADEYARTIFNSTLSSGATVMELSPTGKEIALIVRGDVFVTSIDHKTTRRITNTAEQERNLSFSKDGKTLLYSSERNGIWSIYQTKIKRADIEQFVYAEELEETQFMTSSKTLFQPKFSPDGEKVAYIEDRITLKVYDMKTKKSVTVLDPKYNYSYSDGDQYFEWSPDSKWLAVKFFEKGGWNSTDVGIVPADGSKDVFNLTESGYSDSGASWSNDGKVILWRSDRAGYRSHGSWGAEGDIYAMYLDPLAWKRFRMSKEERELADMIDKKEKEAKEKAAKDKASKGKKSNDKEKGDTAKIEDKPVLFAYEGREDRVARITTQSAGYGDCVMDKKGEKVWYIASIDGSVDLWLRDYKEGTHKVISRGIGWGLLSMDKDEKFFYTLAGGSLKKIDASSGSVTYISYECDFEYKPVSERAYIFEHEWRQVLDKFYDPNIHGIDWKMYRKVYERFLPHIQNNFDFSEMLGELLGELNGSHTGSRYSYWQSCPQTATLGAFFDVSYKGDGLKIGEIIARGSLDDPESKIEVGDIILTIDGKAIKANESYFPLLDDKAGKRVLLTLQRAGSKDTYEEYVKPISYGSQQGLLYRRWIDSRAELVDKLSKGRLAYIHVQGMNSDSFRKTYSELLGKYRNREAVIIDTRYNGGGWLHDDLATLLSGKAYMELVPRGNYVATEPISKWTKPSIVLMSEGNYSNAHGFPFVYRELGIGKLVGMPVPGTMTAVWWETQIDPSLVFGIPQLGIKDMKGNFLENMQLEPDVLINNDPNSVTEGRDPQIEKCVEVMLGDLDGKKR